MREKSWRRRLIGIGVLASATIPLACGSGGSEGNPSFNEAPSARGVTVASIRTYHVMPPEFERSPGRFILPPGFPTQWPIEQIKDISSTFGPRQKASESSRPDFHRGIDIPSPSGSIIRPILGGRIYKVVDGDESSEGGKVVTVEHPLPGNVSFQGKPVERFYSQYSHLDEFGAKAQAWMADPSQEISVTPDEGLGTVGTSGTTEFSHLHFETRLQTNCSLEYQVTHPSSQCALYGYDPHVNPLQFFLENDLTPPLLVEIEKSNHELRTTFATESLSADFDFVALQLFDGDNKLEERRIGFNSREGFDASSTEALDSPALLKTLVEPAAFLSGSNAYHISFRFDLAETPEADRALLLYEDVWENGAVAELLW